MLKTSQRFRKSSDVVHRRVAGESILVPVRGSVADMQRLYALDAVAEQAWDGLDGVRSVGDLAESITNVFDVDADKALVDLCAFLAQLLEQGLITEVDDRGL